MADTVTAPGLPQVTNATVGKLDATRQQQFWVGEIERSCKYYSDYWDLCDSIYERYRDERASNKNPSKRTSDGGRIQLKRFNILWSNVKTMFPAVYDGLPEPVVGRRYKDEDPLARLSVELLERSLAYLEDPPEDTCTFDAAARAAVLDYLLIARGLMWQRHEREVEETVETISDIDPESGEEIEVEEVKSEEVQSESNEFDHIRYRDFLTMIAPSWDHIAKRGWVGRLHFMTKPEAKDEFGADKAAQMQLTASDTAVADGQGNRGTDNAKKGKEPKYGEVWELWNVPDRKVYYVCKGMTEPMDVRDDPLKLRNFFPCQRPLVATITPDTMIPVPDYVLYYDQAENLDRITDKIWKLTTALRVAGFYAGKEGQQIQQVFDGSDRNVMIPVQDWEHIQGSGGIDGLITWVPIDMIIQALQGLYQAEEYNKQQIYEITGVADIVRGQSKASETLGAQRLKGQWASVRISDRQAEVAKFLRGGLRITAEIVAEHYDPKTIAEMTNFAHTDYAQDETAVQKFQSAIQLLRDDKMRSFKVDVETEDTVFADQMQERQQNVEMLTGMAQFMQASAEIGAMMPESVPVLGEMLKAGMKSFSGTQARQLEVHVDEMVAQISEKVAKAQANPQPSAEEQEVQLEQQKAEAELKIKQEELDLKRQELALKGVEAQTDKEKARGDLVVSMEKVKTDREGQFLQAMNSGDGGEGDGGPSQLEQLLGALLQATQQMAQAAQTMAGPKEVVRDETGRVVGTQPATMQ